MKLFPSYINLTSFHIRHLTKRPEKPVERDLHWLKTRGYLKCKDNPHGRFAPKVHFLTQKGWNWSFKEKLFEEEVHAVSGHGSMNLIHDLVLTDLHIKLHDLFADQLSWTQLYQHCYRRFGKKENDRVNMDAFFSFPIGGEYANFAVETERSRDSVKGGLSSRMNKVDAYEAFARGPYQEEFGKGADFRVLWTFSSQDKVINFAVKAHLEKDATRRHWVLDESAIPTITRNAQVFVTPRDIEQISEQRRWNAQRLYSLGEA